MLLGGATDQALKLVNGLDEGDNGNANVLALKAAISYKLKDNASALRQAQAALKIDPANVDAMMVLAADRLANGDPKGALQIIDSQSCRPREGPRRPAFKIRVFEQLGDMSQIESPASEIERTLPEGSCISQATGQILYRSASAGRRRKGSASDRRRRIRKIPKLNLISSVFLRRSKDPRRRDRNSLIASAPAATCFPIRLHWRNSTSLKAILTDSFKLLETLASNTSSPEHALTAKIKLAEMNLSKQNIDAADALVSEILSERQAKYQRVEASGNNTHGSRPAGTGNLRLARGAQ